MPAYISDAKRERARWMTFTEVVALVAKHDRCDRDCAEQQLRDALTDHKLIVRWEDQAKAAPNWSGGPTPILDRPPDDPRFWQQTPIREDTVFDPYTQRERSLLLHRLSVQNIWPDEPPVPPPPEGPRPKGGRPSKIEKVKQLLSGVDLTGLADAIRCVKASWPASDGPPPSAKTIKRAVEQMLGDKTRQDKTGQN
jgi:hypothetical protein